MSIDASLKIGGGLKKHRNVLTRTERLERLLSAGRYTESSAHILGMPKVANRKVAVGGKVKKAPEATDAKTPAKGKKK